MHIRFFLFLIFILSASGASALDETALKEEHRLLQSELRLAKKPKIYLIFNLKEGEILIKWRGIVLRKLKTESTALWSKRPEPEPLVLLKRGSLFEPGRKEIVPKDKGDEETETLQLDALEVDDMPSNFRLLLGKGVSIHIRGKPEGIISRIGTSYHRFAWHSTRPAHSIWSLIRGKPSTSIYIMMEKREAQSLYWIFHEGLECIIY